MTTKQSDTESNSSSSYTRRRSERLRKKYGEDLERFRYSVSPSPVKRRRKSKTGATTQSESEHQETTDTSAWKLLETVSEGKNNQPLQSSPSMDSRDHVHHSSPSLSSCEKDENHRSLKRVGVNTDPSLNGLMEQYEEFCRQLQPHLYTKYSVATFQVAKDLYLVRKWPFIRVIPLVSLERYVIVGSPNDLQHKSIVYSVIPVPTDSMLTPALMDRLVSEAMENKLGLEITACIFAIIENDTTTAYYRISNTFDDLICETELKESIDEVTNQDSDG